MWNNFLYFVTLSRGQPISNNNREKSTWSTREKLPFCNDENNSVVNWEGYYRLRRKRERSRRMVVVSSAGRYITHSSCTRFSKTRGSNGGNEYIVTKKVILIPSPAVKNFQNCA